MIAAGIAAAGILGVLLLVRYMGGFEQVVPQVETVGGEWVVYDSFTGDYAQSGKVIDRVYDRLKEEGVETFRGFGLYFDDPRLVPKGERRAEVGCLLEEDDPALLGRLKGSFTVKQLPRKAYVCASFPYRGPLSALFYAGKVHPLLAETARQAGGDPAGALWEIYDIPLGRVFFRKEITPAGDGR